MITRKWMLCLEFETRTGGADGKSASDMGPVIQLYV